MSSPATSVSEGPSRIVPAPINREPNRKVSADARSNSEPAMGRICIELFTRATLYAGAIGLIAGLLAALIFRE